MIIYWSFFVYLSQGRSNIDLLVCYAPPPHWYPLPDSDRVSAPQWSQVCCPLTAVWQLACRARQPCHVRLCCLDETAQCWKQWHTTCKAERGCLVCVCVCVCESSFMRDDIPICQDNSTGTVSALLAALILLLYWCYCLFRFVACGPSSYTSDPGAYRAAILN